MTDAIVALIVCFLLAYAMLLSCDADADYDSDKQTMLAKWKEQRRANERRFEACYSTCIGEKK